MRMNKIAVVLVFVFMIGLPFASAQQVDFVDASGSRFLNELSLEEFLLYGGLTYENIGYYQGEACIKPAVLPRITVPPPVDYLEPLTEMEMPSYGFIADTEFIKARMDRMNEIVRLSNEAFLDPAVQDYMMFADSPVLYQNTDYGLFFGTIADSMAFGQEALQLVGQITNSAYQGAMWINYGYMTNSGMPGVALHDYAEFNILFNGLMEQVQSNSELENAVDYAANVLGSQMDNQAATNNIFQAHEQLDVAGDSMQRAQDFFDAGDQAAAAGKGPLAQRLDFMGMMNVAQGFYSMGEAYKLKQAVLFMILDGTFRNNQKLQSKLGIYLGPPCDPIPAVCPVPPGEPPFSVMMNCCEGCPPAMYILTPSVAPCVASGQGRPPGPGVPGYTPLPGGTPAPSPLPGAGGAVAALEGADDFPRPIYKFRKENVPALKKWYSRIPSYPGVPEEFKPHPRILVSANAENVDVAKEAVARAAGLSVAPAKITFNGRPVFIAPEKDRVVLLDEGGSPVSAVNTDTPDALALGMKVLPEQYAPDVAVVVPEKMVYEGRNVVIASDGSVVDAETGEVLKNIGADAGFKFRQYKRAEQRMIELAKAVEYEEEGKPLVQKSAANYLEALRNDLSIQLNAINDEYKHQLSQINAVELGFKERYQKQDELFAKTNADLIRAVEAVVASERVEKFALLFPGKEGELSMLLEKREASEDYDEVVKVNAQLIGLMFGGKEGYAEYYSALKEQNKPFESKALNTNT